MGIKGASRPIIPTAPICIRLDRCRNTKHVIGSRPTLMKLMVESANSSAGSNANPAKVGVWVRA